MDHGSFKIRLEEFEKAIDFGTGASSGPIMHVSAGKTFGGVEKMLMALAIGNQNNSRYRHIFALCFEGLVFEKLRSLGGSPILFGPARRIGILRRIFANRKLEFIAKNERPLAIVYHGDWAYDLFAGSARRLGIKIFKMLHNVGRRSSGFLGWLAARNSADLVIANSYFTARNFLKSNPIGKVVTAYPPLIPFNDSGKAEKRSRIREALGICESTLVILTAARFEYGKGHDILVDALAGLGGDRDWVWMVAGDSHQGNELAIQKKIKSMVQKKLPADRVKWLGHIDDLGPYYHCADVYCQANRYPESYGLSFAEADQLGCRVLTSEIGSAREVLGPNLKHIFVEDPCPAAFTTELMKIYRENISASGVV